MFDYNELDAILEKYRENYKLNKTESKKAKDLLSEGFKKNNDIQKLLNYVVLFPEEIGIQALYKRYINLNEEEQLELLSSFTYNDILLNNKNNRSVNRMKFLIARIFNDKDNYHHAKFLLKKLNEIILISKEDSNNHQLLDIFSLDEELKKKKRELEENLEKMNEYKSRIKSLEKKIINFKDEIESKDKKIEELQKKIDKLLVSNQRKNQKSLMEYKNKLAGILKPDYKNIKEIDSKSIDEEMGKVLKIKMEELFKKLKENDIPLEE